MIYYIEIPHVVFLVADSSVSSAATLFSFKETPKPAVAPGIFEFDQSAYRL